MVATNPDEAEQDAQQPQNAVQTVQQPNEQLPLQQQRVQNKVIDASHSNFSRTDANATSCGSGVPRTLALRTTATTVAMSMEVVQLGRGNLWKVFGTVRCVAI